MARRPQTLTTSISTVQVVLNASVTPGSHSQRSTIFILLITNAYGVSPSLCLPQPPRSQALNVRCTARPGNEARLDCVPTFLPLNLNTLLTASLPLSVSLNLLPLSPSLCLPQLLSLSLPLSVSLNFSLSPLSLLLQQVLSICLLSRSSSNLWETRLYFVVQMAG